MTTDELPDRELIGRPKIAAMLGVSTNSVMLFVLRKELPARWIDGRVFARVGDVRRFREARAAQHGELQRQA